MDYIYINAEVYKSGHISYNVFKTKKSALANSKRWYGWQDKRSGDTIMAIRTYRILGMECIGWLLCTLDKDLQTGWELIQNRTSGD